MNVLVLIFYVVVDIKPWTDNLAVNAEFKVAVKDLTWEILMPGFLACSVSLCEHKSPLTFLLRCVFSQQSLQINWQHCTESFPNYCYEVLNHFCSDAACQPATSF